MIKLISCFRKLDDISIQVFRKYWDSPEFNDLIRAVAESSKARSFAKNSTLQVDMNQFLAELRNSKQPFEGTIEYWWDNAREFQEVTATASFVTATQNLMTYQRSFIDFSNSHSFFTEHSTEKLS